MPSSPSPSRAIGRRAFLGTAAAGALGIGGYGGLVEPRRLTVTRHVANGRAAGARAVNAVQLSDLHLRGVGSIHHRIARLLAEVRPDLLLFTGDSVDAPDGLEPLRSFLGMLDGSLPKFAILGNWEHWGAVDAGELAEVYAGAGCRLLVNESVAVEVGGGRLAITGLDDLVGGHPDPARALREVPDAGAHLLLAHCPAHRDRVEGLARTTLMLSGHTHGGQIAPFGWAPMLPPGSGPYRAGWYHDGGAVPLYVSRGIGTSVVPVRLGAPPEVAVFTVWV
jgi:uncharacterized protein